MFDEDELLDEVSRRLGEDPIDEDGYHTQPLTPWNIDIWQGKKLVNEDNEVVGDNNENEETPQTLGEWKGEPLFSSDDTMSEEEARLFWLNRGKEDLLAYNTVEEVAKAKRKEKQRHRIEKSIDRSMRGRSVVTYFPRNALWLYEAIYVEMCNCSLSIKDLAQCVGVPYKWLTEFQVPIRINLRASKKPVEHIDRLTRLGVFFGIWMNPNTWGYLKGDANSDAKKLKTLIYEFFHHGNKTKPIAQKFRRYLLRRYGVPPED